VLASRNSFGRVVSRWDPGTRVGVIAWAHRPCHPTSFTFFSPFLVPLTPFTFSEITAAALVNINVRVDMVLSGVFCIRPLYFRPTRQLSSSKSGHTSSLSALQIMALSLVSAALLTSAECLCGPSCISSTSMSVVLVGSSSAFP
jgi:hypothetical protein